MLGYRPALTYNCVAPYRSSTNFNMLADGQVGQNLNFEKRCINCLYLNEVAVAVSGAGSRLIKETGFPRLPP